MSEEVEASEDDGLMEEMPYSKESPSSPDSGMSRFVADSQSPKIKQEERGASSSSYFTANTHLEHSGPEGRQVPLRGRGHASYKEDESAGLSQLSYDSAHMSYSYNQASAATAASRGYKQALQGAKLLPTATSGADQVSDTNEELRCKVLESEVKRLKQQLSRSEDNLRLKNEEVHRVRRELESSRRNIKDLQDTLTHQKDLLKVYQQLVGGTKNLVAPVEPLRMTCERPQSPQPTPTSKRTRSVSTCDLPVDQRSFDCTVPLKRLSEDASQNDSFNPAKRSRHSSEYPACGLSDRPSDDRTTLRWADNYDPPYAVKKQDTRTDRYVPAAQTNNRSTDKYRPSSSKGLRTSTGATASLDMTPPAKIEVPQATFPSPSTGIAPISGGECHPSGLKGSALDAFRRAQQLGTPYDPAKHIGIPRQCTMCSEILGSEKRFKGHMRAKHPGSWQYQVTAKNPWLK